MGHSLAHAYALPPKEVSSKYEWAKDLKPLLQIKALALVPILREPVLHGGMRWANDELQVLSADGTTIRRWRPYQGRFAEREPSSITLEAAEKMFWAAPLSPVFEVNGPKLDYRPERKERVIWSIQMGMDLTGYEWNPKTQTWLGWTLSPRQLFVLADPYRNFHRIAWSAEGEPVRFLACDTVRTVLIENIDNGLSRFSFFKDAKPVGYTLFDFAGGTRRSEITSVAALGCSDFVVSGSFGVTRVAYPRW